MPINAPSCALHLLTLMIVKDPRSNREGSTIHVRFGEGFCLMRMEFYLARAMLDTNGPFHRLQGFCSVLGVAARCINCRCAKARSTVGLSFPAVFNVAAHQPSCRGIFFKCRRRNPILNSIPIMVQIICHLLCTFCTLSFVRANRSMPRGPSIIVSCGAILRANGHEFIGLDVDADTMVAKCIFRLVLEQASNEG